VVTQTRTVIMKIYEWADLGEDVVSGPPGSAINCTPSRGCDTGTIAGTKIILAGPRASPALALKSSGGANRWPGLRLAGADPLPGGPGKDAHGAAEERGGRWLVVISIGTYIREDSHRRRRLPLHFEGGLASSPRNQKGRRSTAQQEACRGTVKPGGGRAAVNDSRP